MTRKLGSSSDPLWYKDAVIYELHVRTFYDANQDGIGDFRGLIEKLDYLADLGVTCLWLLPFYPSPLRDDGYDISDYTDVHPSYGTVDDFKEFLEAAHTRGMQVMIELVVNHTSDQHPWFQRARQAPPGSPERDFYVWSESKHRYADARIIFTDTEQSNWTWDATANAYYWHRFFSHQPDLNFDNPAVLEEIIRAMRFWLDLGVDALRLDAIPYLVEREGTSCENLPDTHEVIKRIRAVLDAEYENRMLLAEANQWPADVRAYFGEGDECHMAFHFPLMPRLFMALRLEDRHPVTDVMAQTPPIPEGCQWGLFLRNHDELTLEMVSDDERAYMYLAYSMDPRMRVNVGIRRRLAPLLENNRRRIELLNSIVYSFPGTPILYYGDEIAMGDNIYLGDRNSVRTPMQWSGDRNAGFSRANPARLYSPVIMDPVYGYEAVNVEAQQGEPSSMLNWTRHMIALRKLFKVFGRGTIEFLHPANRKILAYLRRHDGEVALCVANLSRFAQPCELEIPALAGMTPVEMLGYVEFPRIGRTAYPLTLAPYGFLWFELHGEPETAEAGVAAAAPRLEVDPAAGAAALAQPAVRHALEKSVLPAWLSERRWFAGRNRQIRTCRVSDQVSLTPEAALCLIEIGYDGEERETYVLPLALAHGEEAEALRGTHPEAVLCGTGRGGASGVLYDALASDEACRALLAVAEGGSKLLGDSGVLSGGGAAAGAGGAPPEPPSVARITTEQTNSTLVFGDRVVMKVFRRLEQGPQPDCEVVRYLSEVRRHSGVPGFAGVVEWSVPRVAAATTVAMLQRVVGNQGDGWRWMQEELGRFSERALTLPPPEPVRETGVRSWLSLGEAGLSPAMDELLGVSDDAAAMLGRRTADLHLALAHPTDDPAFSPEPLRSGDLELLADRIRRSAWRVFEQLKAMFPRLPDDLVESASRVMSARGRMAARIDRVIKMAPQGLKTRIHGNYHLGDVLRTGADFVVIDFEGDPALGLAERRARESPLKDVAGMLRSFAYAGHVALLGHVARRPGDLERLAPWTRVWERSVCAVFLHAYLATVAGAGLVPERTEEQEALLEAFLVEKALAELRYELDNRPGWVAVPLLGLEALLGTGPSA